MDSIINSASYWSATINILCGAALSDYLLNLGGGEGIADSVGGKEGGLRRGMGRFFYLKSILMNPCLYQSEEFINNLHNSRFKRI